MYHTDVPNAVSMPQELTADNARLTREVGEHKKKLLAFAKKRQAEQAAAAKEMEARQAEVAAKVAELERLRAELEATKVRDVVLFGQCIPLNTCLKTVF